MMRRSEGSFRLASEIGLLYLRLTILLKVVEILWSTYGHVSRMEKAEWLRSKVLENK
jgi:hypothetical protein